MTFSEYIRARRITNTPAGDFVKDAREDGQLPGDFPSWDRLHSYLGRRSACSEAIDAARTVWRGYLAAKRRAAGR
jgi:hypothetical protein